jgi:hypothetical protein
MSDPWVNALIISPLFRNLSTIPTDLHVFTHHVSQQMFPFSRQIIEESPVSSGQSWDQKPKFRISQVGYLEKLQLKVQYRIYPWSRTHITPAFFYPFLGEISLRSHGQSIETTYGDLLKVKHATFTQPEEAISKLRGAMNRPIPIESYQHFTDLFNRYLPSSTTDSTQTAKANLVDNSNDKYVQGFEMLNPAHWGIPSTSPSQTYYGVVSFYIDLDFSFTDNICMFLDTRFVELLDVNIELRSTVSENPLFQAWGCMGLNPTRVMTPAAPSSALTNRAPLCPYDDANRTALGGPYSNQMAADATTTFTDAQGSTGFYGAASSGSYACPNIPYYMTVGAGDFDVSNYRLCAGGQRSTDFTTDYTDSTNVVASLRGWVLAHYYMAFPWLAVDSASNGTTWSTTAHFNSSTTSWAARTWPSTIRVEGGSSYPILGTPDASNLSLTLLCSHLTPHDSVREDVSTANYMDDEPATLLSYNIYREYNEELYGTAESDYAVGETIDLQLTSKNLVSNIIVLAHRQVDDIDINGQTPSDYQQPTRMIYVPSGAGVTKTAAGLDSTTYYIQSAPHDGDKVQYAENTSSDGAYKFCPSNYGSLISMTLNEQDRWNLKANRQSRVPILCYKNVENFKTVLPYICNLKSTGRTIWSLSDGDSATLGDAVQRIGHGAPVHDMFTYMHNIHYNQAEARGFLGSPLKLPDLFASQVGPKAISEKDAATIGKMSDHLSAVVITPSYNPTDWLSCGGAFSLQSMTSPTINLAYDEPCRISIFDVTIRVLQIDSNSGAITSGLDI